MNKSWFFVPGSKDKFLAKSLSLDTDVIIFDLEDSVVPDDKEEARLKVKEFLLDNQRASQEYVRVNDIHSPYFIDDVKELAGTDIDGIMVPKVKDTDDIKIIDYILSRYEGGHHVKDKGIKVVPLIETGKGIGEAHAIAASSGRIECLAFGGEDYKLDLNISTNDESALMYARMTLLNASGAAGIEPPIDGVFTDFHDQQSLEENCLMSRGLGFQGKLTIHPNQLETVNRVYSPTEEEMENARKIVEAYEESIDTGSGALEVDGRMIDAPVAERAKKLLGM